MPVKYYFWYSISQTGDSEDEFGFHHHTNRAILAPKVTDNAILYFRMSFLRRDGTAKHTTALRHCGIATPRDGTAAQRPPQHNGPRSATAPQRNGTTAATALRRERVRPDRAANASTAASRADRWADDRSVGWSGGHADVLSGSLSCGRMADRTLVWTDDQSVGRSGSPPCGRMADRAVDRPDGLSGGRSVEC